MDFSNATKPVDQFDMTKLVGDTTPTSADAVAQVEPKDVSFGDQMKQHAHDYLTQLQAAVAPAAGASKPAGRMGGQYIDTSQFHQEIPHFATIETPSAMPTAQTHAAFQDFLGKFNKGAV